MDWLLNSEHSQNLQLNGCQIIKEVIELHIFPGRLNTLINGYNELIGLFNSECPLGIDNGLDPHLNEFLLKNVEVLKVILLVNKVVL